MVQRWVPTGCLVLDLYAGLAPMARACKATGRDYLGAEIDPERHRHAMAKLDGTPWCADARQEALF
jgi:DNA modification methylase